MARVLRGDIRWAHFGPAHGHEQAGNRPVLVLSADVFNERTATAIVVALTTREPPAGFPLSLEIDSNALPKRSWALMGQVRTFSTRRLGPRLTRASEEDLARVVEGLNEILG